MDRGARQVRSPASARCQLNVARNGLTQHPILRVDPGYARDLHGAHAGKSFPSCRRRPGISLFVGHHPCRVMDMVDQTLHGFIGTSISAAAAIDCEARRTADLTRNIFHNLCYANIINILVA